MVPRDGMFEMTIIDGRPLNEESEACGFEGIVDNSGIRYGTKGQAVGTFEGVVRNSGMVIPDEGNIDVDGVVEDEEVLGVEGYLRGASGRRAGVCNGWNVPVQGTEG